MVSGLTIEPCGRAYELSPVHPAVKNSTRRVFSQPAPTNLDCQDAPVLVAPAKIKKLDEGISGGNILKIFNSLDSELEKYFLHLKISDNFIISVVFIGL